MKALLDNKKLQRMIIRSVAVLIVAVILILLVIPGVQNSQFSQLKKYDTERGFGEALKRKQQMSDSRYYQTKGFIESHDDNIYRIGDFTTNLRSDSRKKLILNISVKYSDNDVAEELEEKNPLVRNAVIGVASDAQYLHSLSGKDLLKKQLVEELNSVVHDGTITEVYFNKFIIQ